MPMNLDVYKRQEYVDVVRHQAVGVDGAIWRQRIAIFVLRVSDLVEDFQKLTAVLLVVKYSFIIETAQNHMVHASETGFSTFFR